MKQFSPQQTLGWTIPLTIPQVNYQVDSHEKKFKKNAKMDESYPTKKHQIDEWYIPVIPLNSISTYNSSIWCFYGFVSWDIFLRFPIGPICEKIPLKEFHWSKIFPHNGRVASDLRSLELTGSIFSFLDVRTKISAVLVASMGLREVGYGRCSWNFTKMVFLPSGKRLHNYGKSPLLMGKLTIHGHFQ